MAAKKKASKKKAVAKKSSSKEVAIGWKAALSKHATEGKKSKEKPVQGNHISIKGSKFSLGGQVLGRELDCVIINWGFEKSWYDSDYVEGEASCPACFALSYDEDDLVPDDTAPNPQSDVCEGCELNEWGSGRGDGKACADRRRLALVVEGTDGKMQLAQINIPPTSLKNWKSYISEVESIGLETLQVACNISFDEDSTATQAPLVFEVVSEITKEATLNKMAAQLEASNKLIEQPYDASNYTSPSNKGKGKKKGSKKKVAKKKAGKKKRSKFS